MMWAWIGIGVCALIALICIPLGSYPKPDYSKRPSLAQSADLITPVADMSGIHPAGCLIICLLLFGLLLTVIFMY